MSVWCHGTYTSVMCVHQVGGPLWIVVLGVLELGPCTACALGRYKNNNDSVACVSCPIDTYIDAETSAFCKACPQFTTSIIESVSVTACNCKLGYTGLGGSATAIVYSNLARTCGTDSNQVCLSAASSTRGGTTSNALDNDVNTIFITEAGEDQWFTKSSSVTTVTWQIFPSHRHSVRTLIRTLLVVKVGSSLSLEEHPSVLFLLPPSWFSPFFTYFFRLLLIDNARGK